MYRPSTPAYCLDAEESYTRAFSAAGETLLIWKIVMAETVKPTISQRMQASEDRDALVHNLDDLFERYLNLLHEYQIVRRELAKHLSSVCSLTIAVLYLHILFI